MLYVQYIVTCGGGMDGWRKCVREDNVVVVQEEEEKKKEQNACGGKCEVKYHAVHMHTHTEECTRKHKNQSEHIYTIMCIKCEYNREMRKCFTIIVTL